MEWVASTLHTTSEHGVSSITTADAHTSAASDAHADLNGLARFPERRNLVSARVPSHFNWPLPKMLGQSSRVNCSYENEEGVQLNVCYEVGGFLV